MTRQNMRIGDRLRTAGRAITVFAVALIWSLPYSIAYADKALVLRDMSSHQGISAETSEQLTEAVVEWLRAKAPGTTVQLKDSPRCAEPTGYRECLVRYLESNEAAYAIEIVVHKPKAVWALVSITTKDDIGYVRSSVSESPTDAALSALQAAWVDLQRGPGPWLNIYGLPAGSEVRLNGQSLCRLPCVAMLAPGLHDLTLHDRKGLEIVRERVPVRWWGTPTDLFLVSTSTKEEWEHRGKPTLPVVIEPDTSLVPKARRIRRSPVTQLASVPPVEPISSGSFPFAWRTTPQKPDDTEQKPEPIVLAVRPEPLPSIAARAQPPSYWGPALLTGLAASTLAFGIVPFLLDEQCVESFESRCVTTSSPKRNLGAAAIAAGAALAAGSAWWWVRVSGERRDGHPVFIGTSATSATLRVQF